MQAKHSIWCLADSRHPTNDYFLLLCLSIFRLPKPERESMIFVLPMRSWSHIGSVKHCFVVKLMGCRTAVPPRWGFTQASWHPQCSSPTDVAELKFEPSSISFESGFFCVSHSLLKTSGELVSEGSSEICWAGKTRGKREDFTWFLYPFLNNWDVTTFAINNLKSIFLKLCHVDRSVLP